MNHGTAVQSVAPPISKRQETSSVNLFHLKLTFILPGKGKSVPAQAWSGPEGSRKLRLPDYMTTAQDGGKVVSLTNQPPLPQEMLLVLISVRG